MSDTNLEPIDADDPGLTAFALGELEGPEADRYAAAVAASPALQAVVLEVQAAAQLLCEELQLEPKMAMSAERRAEIVARAHPESSPLTQPKRYFGLSPQTAAVAASLLLVPAGWYGFRAIQPQRADQRLMAIREHDVQSSRTPFQAAASPGAVGKPATLDGTKTRLTTRMAQDGELTFTHNDASAVEQVDSISVPAVATGPAKSEVAASGAVSDPASHKTGVLTGGRDLETAKQTFELALKERESGNSGGKDQKMSQLGQKMSQLGQKMSERGEAGQSGNSQPGKAGATELNGDQLFDAEAGAGSGEKSPGERKPRSADDYGVASNRFGDGKPGQIGMRGSQKAGSSSDQQSKGLRALAKNGKELNWNEQRGRAAQGGSKPSSEAARPEDRVHDPRGDNGAEVSTSLGSVAQKGDKRLMDKVTLAKESMPQSGDRNKGKGKASGSDGKESQPESEYLSEERYAKVPLADLTPGDESSNDSSKPSSGSEAKNGNGQQKPSEQNEAQMALIAARDARSKDKTFDFSDEGLDGFRAGSKQANRPLPNDPTSDEAYKPIYENSFISAAREPLSTFSIDVDTASYANLRRFIQGGQLPPADAVRIEELVNYFAYAYPQPQDGRPFSVQADIATCPWQPAHQLVRIGLKGKEIPKAERPPTNLVFLVDVSGSMAPANKLPLVRESLKTLVNQLDERDRIALVTYAGQAGIALESTSVAQRHTILSAIDSLGAGGSTNGAAGINTAYDIAAKEFLEKGTNRVILCTDGDFNVGVTTDEALIEMIQTRAKGGVFLSVFGFGMGNLKDAKLEQLADKGNGQYGYIDDQQEANKVFVEEMMGTLVTIAKDVKIQIDFNKDIVETYRLVGYENRVMAAEDFHNDKKDAGEIGSGHTVTALYEIVPVKDAKIQNETRWLTVKLRYKQPQANESVLFETPLAGVAGQFKLAPSEFQFAAGVAACGMLLRHSQHAGQANWGLVKELAQSGLSFDPHGHRRSFLGLVSQAESLMGQLRPQSPPSPESTVRGKYKSLLRRLNTPEDEKQYGQFNDYGYSDTKTYAGSENLPAGYWVYVAPYWYIWAESSEAKASNKPPTPSERGPGL